MATFYCVVQNGSWGIKPVQKLACAILPYMATSQGTKPRQTLEDEYLTEMFSGFNFKSAPVKCNVTRGMSHLSKGD